MIDMQIKGKQYLTGNVYRCVQTNRGCFLVIDTAITEEDLVEFAYIKCNAAQAQQLQAVKTGQQVTVAVHVEPTDQTWPVDHLLVADSIKA